MNIVITGASSGIGYDTALLLSQNRQHQITAISRNIGALEQLAANACHQNIKIIATDLTQDISHLSNQITEVDILINNAGQLINKPFEHLTDSDWTWLFQVNVLAPVRLTRQLLPLMGQSSQRGHIVNIGSMGGYQGSSKFPGLLAYSASKAALANFSECLAEELKDRNISVNCLALGAVQTAMLATAFPDYQAPLSSEKMASFLANFATEGQFFYNGKILPVSVTTP